MLTRLLCSVVGLLSLSIHLSAAPAAPRSDAQIANDAQVVVVARVKPGSLKNICHSSSDQNTFETEGVLLVTQVLKGTVTVKELPIVLDSCALPVPKSRITKDFGDYDSDFPAAASPYVYDFSAPIPLYEYHFDGPINKMCDDVRKEQIWFLRPYESKLGTKEKPGTLGVLDFRDVQPLSKEDAFKAIIK